MIRSACQFGRDGRKWHFLVLLVALSVYLPSVALAKTAQAIARETFEAVVLIVVSDAHGQALSLGSGFVVQPGIVVTNYHVIKDGTKASVKLVGKPDKFDVMGVLAIDVGNDLALLKSDERLTNGLPLADSNQSPTVGDTIFAAGNPRGLEGTFSTGIVSGIRSLKNTTLIQITAPISPGSSGGPVLDSSGKVIGVAVSTYRGGQNLNFAIPASHVRSLMAGQQKLSSLSSVSTHTEKPSWVSFGGDEKQAVYVSHVEMGFDGIRFSVQNKTPYTIGKVFGLIILHDKNGDVVDTTEFEVPREIQSGLACRTFGALNMNAVRLADMSRTQIRILSMQKMSD